MKKITSVIIAAAITLSTTACVNAVETDAPHLTAENGKITVTNAVENGRLIIAFYDGGILAGANMYKGIGTIEIDMEAVPEKVDTLKAFYWDMGNITPLGNMIDLPIDEIPTPPIQDDEKENGIMIKIGDKEFGATLYDNETAAAFRDLLPMTLDMIELNGNEKYFNLSLSLPTNTERVGTINAGDIMLYGSNCVVLFYETFSTTYSYTRIGHIDDVTGLKDAVGSGNVTVVFE